MKSTILSLICGTIFACPFILKAQAPSPIQDTTMFTRQHVRLYEIYTGYGNGSFGHTITIGIRHKFLGLTTLFTDFGGRSFPAAPLNQVQTPFRNLNTIKKALVTYGLTLDLYIPLQQQIFLVPSLGIANRTYEYTYDIQSDWVYERQILDEEKALCYGIGAAYYIPLNDISDITLSVSYRNIFGIVGSLGFAF
jgi:hypothetical protein